MNPHPTSHVPRPTSHAPLAARFLEQALLITILAHAAAMLSMALLLLPGLPGGGNLLPPLGDWGDLLP